MKYIKQYGIQRSGTNFMRAMFEMNMDCRVLSNIGGFKHGRITNATNMGIVKTEIPMDEINRIDQDLQANIIPRIVVIRNPYAWVPSISRYYNKPITKEFIDQQMERYVGLNSHWAKECDSVIYYEEFMECPEKIINQASERFGLTRTTDKIVMPQGVMKRGGDMPAVQNIYKNIRFNYNKNNDYLTMLSREQQNQIRDYEEQMWFLKL